MGAKANFHGNQATWPHSMSLRFRVGQMFIAETFGLNRGDLNWSAWVPRTWIILGNASRGRELPQFPESQDDCPNRNLGRLRGSSTTRGPQGPEKKAKMRGKPGSPVVRTAGQLIPTVLPGTSCSFWVFHGWRDPFRGMKFPDSSSLGFLRPR